MNILLVEKSAEQLEAFCDHLERIAFSRLDFEIDISITTANRLDRPRKFIDVVIIGPGLDDEWAKCLEAAKRCHSDAEIIVISSLEEAAALAKYGPLAGTIVSGFEAESVLHEKLQSIYLEAAKNAQKTAAGGKQLNKRYEIIRLLGTGTIGKTYLARHLELANAAVAVKVLFPDLTNDEAAVARFRKEMLLNFGVCHPNVVRIYEYFKDADVIGFIMEFIDGGSLAAKMNSGTPIPVSEVVRILKETSAGLQAIHDAEIVHADLKPENILLTRSGSIKIADFGTAAYYAMKKEVGGVVGTIDYVSPEYLERGEIDSRSDIYALGVLAFEMLTGTSPFTGRSVIETMTSRLRVDPAPPSRHRADCPKELDQIILKALSRSPETRYQTAEDLLQALSALPNSA